MISAFAAHALESTVFALAVGLLTLAFRKNHARVRHGLWMTASLKFLVPFSLLLGLGAGASQVVPRAIHPRLPAAVEEFSMSFMVADPAHTSSAAVAAVSHRLPAILLTMWALGFAAVICRWVRQWWPIRAALRSGRPIDVAGLRAVSTPVLIEPGVFGLFRPVLLVPEGIVERLSRAELESILAHELCHIRHWDNLASASHMLVEALFWFHPLVWWMGRRLVDERERACDEEVLRTGNEPRVYAEGILKVCRLYLESPLACAAGVTGADLKKRIEGIMKGNHIERLNRARKIVLGAAAMAAITGPVLVGMLAAPAGHAQTQPAAQAPSRKPAFEVASIKPSQTGSRNITMRIMPGGRFQSSNITVKQLIQEAYDMRDFQIEGAPNWLNTEHYDINAKAEGVGARPGRDEIRTMLQGLLADRFHMEFHKGSKDLPGYALVVAKGGPKLKAVDATPAPGKGPMMRMGMGQLTGNGVPISFLAMNLARQLGRPVTDKTGLTGAYDFDLHWTPDVQHMGPGGPGGPEGGAPPSAAAAGPEDSGPSIFTAIQEQLGLKLESQKGPTEILIIDRVEKPTEN